MKLSFKTLLAVTALPFLLSACSAAQSSAKPSPEISVKPASSKTVKTAKDLETVKTSSHGQYSKPGAAIDYSYELPKNISAGQTITFQLKLDEAYSTGGLDVGLESEGDLQIFATNTQSRFDMRTDQSHVIDVSFTAPSNGRHYINVSAVTSDGMPRIFSIPVQVGPEQAMKPHKNMITTSSGDNIIVMEAEEVIQ